MATNQRLTLSQTIGQHVREERRRLGLTQEQLAERLALSTNYIAHLERGSRGASLITLEKVSDVLDVTVMSLFAPVGKAGAAKSAPPADEIRRLTARLKGVDPETRKLFVSLADLILTWRSGRSLDKKRRRVGGA